MKIRIFMLFLVTIIFALLGISQVREVSDDIQFPARYGTMLSKMDNSSNNINSNQVYDLLIKKSKENDQKIFKSYINEKGDEVGFSFFKDTKNNSPYSSDIYELKDSSFQSMYYSDKPFTNELIEELKLMGIKVISIELPWYLTGIAFWTDGIRAVGLWCLVFSILLAYFSILNLYKREKYVLRFLGMSRTHNRRELLIDWGIILLTSIFLYFSYLFIFKIPFSSVGSLAYLSILGSNLLIFIILIGLIRISYSIFIRYGNILTSLRGKNNPFLINTVWFIGLITTLLIMPIILNQITQNQSILKQQVDNLNPWEQLNNYRLVSVNLPSSMDNNNNNNQIDVNGDLDLGKKFMTYFDQNEYVFIEKSGVYIPEFLPEETKIEMEQQYAQDHIDYKVMENVVYMNKNAYDLSNQMFKNKSQKIDTNAPATIIVPSKYEQKVESVINATYMEFFQYSTIEKINFKKIVVPNGEETFLFDYNGAELYGFDESRTQRAINQIIVILNMDSVLSTDSAVTTYSNLMKGLFKVEGVSKLSKNPEINQYINGIINPYKSIKLKINRLETRIQGTIFSLVSLILIQIYVVNQFFLSIAKQNIRTITIKRMLGFNLNTLILKTFIWYLLLIGIVLGISFILTVNQQIKGWFLLLNIVEIVSTLLLVKYIIQKNTITVLKGDFEL